MGNDPNKPAEPVPPGENSPVENTPDYSKEPKPGTTQPKPQPPNQPPR